jgi:hypothetical protein
VTDSPVFDPLTATGPVTLLPIRRRRKRLHIDGPADTLMGLLYQLRWISNGTSIIPCNALRTQWTAIAYTISTSLVMLWVHNRLNVPVHRFIPQVPSTASHYTKQDLMTSGHEFRSTINSSDITKKEVFTPVLDAMKNVTLHRSSRRLRRRNSNSPIHVQLMLRRDRVVSNLSKLHGRTCSNRRI